MTHKRTYYPRAETDRSRWKPRYIAVYTRVAVDDNDPRECTRKLVQRVAERMLLERRDDESRNYLNRLQERYRQAELYDYYERMRDEVSLP